MCGKYTDTKNSIQMLSFAVILMTFETQNNIFAVILITFETQNNI